jgi:hypothetical protein
MAGYCERLPIPERVLLTGTNSFASPSLPGRSDPIAAAALPLLGEERFFD